MPIYLHRITVQPTNAVTHSSEHFFGMTAFVRHSFQGERNYPPKLSFVFPCLMLKSCAAKFRRRNCHVAQCLCPVHDCIEHYDKVFNEKILQNNNQSGYILQKHTGLTFL